MTMVESTFANSYPLNEDMQYPTPTGSREPKSLSAKLQTISDRWKVTHAVKTSSTRALRGDVYCELTAAV